MKIRGPSHEPWGMPPVIKVQSERELLSLTLCCLSVRNEYNHRTTSLGTPIAIILFSKVLWSTVIYKQCTRWITIVKCSRPTSAWEVDLCLRAPYWLVSSWWPTASRIHPPTNDLRILLNVAVWEIGLSDTEDRTFVSSFVWTKHQNVTDRQPLLLQRSALWAMRTRCKKPVCVYVHVWPLVTVSNPLKLWFDDFCVFILCQILPIRTLTSFYICIVLRFFKFVFVSVDWYVQMQCEMLRVFGCHGRCTTMCRKLFRVIVQSTRYNWTRTSDLSGKSQGTAIIIIF